MQLILLQIKIIKFSEDDRSGWWEKVTSPINSQMLRLLDCGLNSKIFNSVGVNEWIAKEIAKRCLWCHNFWLKLQYLRQARSQDLEKGGGYFERVRSVQTTLTRIFIDLQSVSDGLSEIWDEMSRKDRKFKGFFRPKLGDLQKKKKKGLRQNSEQFFGRNPKFKRFFRPKLGDLQKK